MTIKLIGLIIGGTIGSDDLVPNQTDVYTALLSAGHTYYFENLFSHLPLRFALASPLGLVETALLAPGQIFSYTPGTSEVYGLSVASEFGGQDNYAITGGDAWVTLTDTTTGAKSNPFMTPYAGPVANLSEQFIDITTHSLNIVATHPSVFLRSGSGMDGLTVTSGDNILDGSTGSNFLIGGTGHDTFYLDDRNPIAPIFSTVVNFHPGDNVTVWGINAADFTMLKLDNQGAAGAKGLDLIFSAPGHVDTSFVLAGYTSADLANGRLSMSYGRTADLAGLPGSEFMTLHAN